MGRQEYRLQRQGTVLLRISSAVFKYDVFNKSFAIFRTARDEKISEAFAVK